MWPKIGFAQNPKAHKDMLRFPGRKILENNRLQAIQLFLKGTKPNAIAHQLNVKPQSVHLWIRIFKQHSWDGLRAKPPKGRPKIKDNELLVNIREFFTIHPNSLGPNPKLWTGPEIVQTLKEQWGIQLNPKYIYRWLHRNGMSHFLSRGSKPLTESPSKL